MARALKVKIVRIWDCGPGAFGESTDLMEDDFNRAAGRKGVRYAWVPVHHYGDEKQGTSEVAVLYRADRKAKDEEVATAANSLLRKEWK